MNIILIILFVIIVACIIDKKGYISYEYEDNIPNYTAYTVDDGDILLSVETTRDMFDVIDNLKNACNNDKVYFHCKDTNRYIEYNRNDQCKFRYVKLDHPPI